MALEGTYPIIIDDKPAGKLTVSVQGACTCFEAECRMLEGITRISVYGGNVEGYLGVLVPDGEQLRFCKCFSRTALRCFPQEIESVERSGRPPLELPAAAAKEAAPPTEEAAPLPEPPVETPAPETPPSDECTEPPVCCECCCPAQPPQCCCQTEQETCCECNCQVEQPVCCCAEEQPEDDCVETPEEKAAPLQEEAAEEEDTLFWYSSPDGALVCYDGTRSLIALPLGDERIPEGYEGHRRVIEGREYLVYITKNGRIIH